jgi:hypothetical protein
MNGSLWTPLLIAQSSAWKHLGDGLHGRRGRTDLFDFWPVALGLVVVAIAVAAVVAIRKRDDMSQKCNDPNKLFRELSLAHKLNRGSQKLLWQLAEAFQLAQPAEVFLTPTLFHSAQLPPELQGEEERLQALHQQLFG